jgi:hypothetical protein
MTQFDGNDSRDKEARTYHLNDPELHEHFVVYGVPITRSEYGNMLTEYEKQSIFSRLILNFPPLYADPFQTRSNTHLNTSITSIKVNSQQA